MQQLETQQVVPLLVTEGLINLTFPVGTLTASAIKQTIQMQAMADGVLPPAVLAIPTGGSDVWQLGAVARHRLPDPVATDMPQMLSIRRLVTPACVKDRGALIV